MRGRLPKLRASASPAGAATGPHTVRRGLVFVSLFSCSCEFSSKHAHVPRNQGRKTRPSFPPQLSSCVFFFLMVRFGSAATYSGSWCDLATRSDLVLEMLMTVCCLSPICKFSDVFEHLSSGS